VTIKKREKREKKQFIVHKNSTRINKGNERQEKHTRKQKERKRKKSDCLWIKKKQASERPEPCKKG
jgi:hypothetical protein